jgi:integration host factor subunit alpha
MAGKMLTRGDLRDALQRTLPKLSQKEATRLIEETLREVEDALVLDGVVSLRRFGNFVVRSKNERMGRNPRIKTSAVIKARRERPSRAPLSSCVALTGTLWMRNRDDAGSDFGVRGSPRRDNDGLA